MVKLLRLFSQYPFFVITSIVFAAIGLAGCFWMTFPMAVKVLIIWSILSYPTWCWYLVRFYALSRSIYLPSCFGWLKVALVAFMLPGISLFVVFRY